MSPYYGNLPMFGRADHGEFAIAKNKRDARKEASRQAVIEAEESPQTDADRLEDVSARLRAALAKFGGAA